MDKEVFISYSRKDLEEVKIIKYEIEKEVGIDCWMDLDGIESGEQFEDVIIEAISKSNILLFMMSANSMQSQWALDELDFARHENKRVVLVSIDHAEMKGKFYFRYHKYDNIIWNIVPQRNKLIRDLKNWTRKPLQEESETNRIAEEKKKQAEAETRRIAEEGSDLLNEPNYSPDANNRKVEEPSDSEMHPELAKDADAKPLKKGAISNPFVKVLDINGGALKPSYSVGIDLFYSMEIKNCEGTKIKITMTLNPLLEGATILKENVFVIDKDNYIDFDGYKEKIENNLLERLFLIFANDFGLSSSGEYYYKVNLSAYDEHNNVLSSYDRDLTIKYNHKILGSDKIKIKEIG